MKAYRDEKNKFFEELMRNKNKYKSRNVADYYNKLYTDDERAFVGEPLPLVKRLTEYIKSGDVLEVGAGGGRNSIYLAHLGFKVTATDISPVSIKNIKRLTTREHIALKTAVFDISKNALAHRYDAIICTFTLHHLRADDAISTIKKIQRNTKPSGFNLITTFTKNGDFYKSNPNTPNFYLDSKAQLKKLYKGWKILRIFEKNGKARALDATGRPQFNVFVGLLAHKIK